MSKDVKVFRMLISCPADVNEEKKYIKKILNDFNRNYGYENNVIFRYEDWKIGTYSTIGKTPQEEINKQLVDECDLAVALFWNKVGTETTNEISGTVEEIERLRKLDKQIFLFFSLRKIVGNGTDIKQVNEVEKIKKKYQNCSLYKEYKSLKDFKDMFENELRLYVQKNRKQFENKKTFSTVTISRTSLQEKVNQSKKSIFIAGASLVSSISTSFINCLNSGIEIHLLMTKEDENLINECSKLSYANKDELKSHIQMTKKHFYEMRKGSKIKIRCINAVMPVSLVGIDINESYGKIYVQQYLYKRDPALCPYYVCYYGEKWYEAYENQINMLWKDSEKIDYIN